MSKYFLLSSLTFSLLLAGCAAPSNIVSHNQLLKSEQLQSSESLSNLSVSNWPTDKWWHQLA